MSKSRGMIFNPEMVNAIDEDRKTETRRPLRKDLNRFLMQQLDPGEFDNELTIKFRDDVRSENNRKLKPQWFVNFTEFPEEGCIPLGKCPYGEIGDKIYVKETLVWDLEDDGVYFYLAKNSQQYSLYGKDKYKKTPSIFMKKEYARTWLEIVDVRLEQVQDISRQECWNEGITGPLWIKDPHNEFNPINQYKRIWKACGYDWDSNPFVWVIIYKKVDGAHDKQ